MQLELTGRHIDITPTLRRLVGTKISRLERVLNDSAVSAHVVLAREKHRYLSEINLHARGDKFLHAIGDSGNWETSLSNAVDKLSQQVRKIKTRRQPWKGGRGAAAKAASLEPAESVESTRTPAAAKPARVRPRMPRTLRASRQAIKPMSLADAARAIDGHPDGIVVFLDTETAAVNVLYRRRDGELTLIEIDV